MLMTHGYFTDKARAVIGRAGGDPDTAGALAEWAEEAKRIGDPRRGVIVAEDGSLVAATRYYREHSDRAGASYVEKADARRWGLHVEETGMAIGELHRITGKQLIHVTMPEMCRGAGRSVPQVDGGVPDPLQSVVDAAAEVEDAPRRLLVAVADAYTAGAKIAPLARAAGVSRPTIYRWLDEQGFTMAADLAVEE
jgi:hypothetical protein